MQSVKIKKYIEAIELEEIVCSSKNVKIVTGEVNRIGLQLVEYYEYFSEQRIQVVGNSEWSYLEKLDSDRRRSIAKKLMSYKIPCIIFTRDLKVFDEFIEEAKENSVVILKSKYTTTKFISKSSEFLDKALAKTVTVHGVLLDVYGIGILIFGKSGIGKSETALELIKRGHRFIADDAITIRKVGEEQIIGEAPPIIRNLLELRGIGIIDISRLYGIGSVREEKQIDLIIEFEEWDKKKNYDRLGLDDKHTSLLDIEVSKLNIPVKPGRNLAMIVEAAAINHRQKSMGFNAAVELEKRLLNE
ncbi:HPr(Ser) kinase/phosphatase [Clostridiaceae bacterium HSG29]|nr:HPr(Ser) kinase/phosphatase [Clostridiaceae bacterium HSG29]